MNDIVILIGRSLRNALRQPATIIPNIAISVFFLFVYNSGLSSVAQLPGFQGTYLGFILPVSIVSAAVGGAGLAGMATQIQPVVTVPLIDSVLAGVAHALRQAQQETLQPGAACLGRFDGPHRHGTRFAGKQLEARGE